MRHAIGLCCALVACGKGTETGDSMPVVPTGTDTATTPTSEPGCLDPGTMILDMVYGWDAADRTTRPVVDTVNSLPVRSLFRANLGPYDWDGDTSLPGQPDRWCFVQWTIDDLADDGRNPGKLLSLSGLDAGQAVTNCGRESAPGAQDEVTLCERAFGGEDPIVAMTSMDWAFRFGGEVAPSVSEVTDYFLAAGYVYENFWGSDMASDEFPAIDTLTYGWPIDAYGNTVLDVDGAPVKFTRAEVEGPDGLPSGLYFHVIPWIFGI